MKRTAQKHIAITHSRFYKDLSIEVRRDFLDELHNSQVRLLNPVNEVARTNRPVERKLRQQLKRRKREEEIQNVINYGEMAVSQHPMTSEGTSSMKIIDGNNENPNIKILNYS